MALTRVVIIFLFGLSISGCYLKASITDLKSKNKKAIPIDESQSSEFVSGTSQLQETPNRHYLFSASVNNFNGPLVSKTPKGYTLYSTVQGNFISSQDGVR